MKIYIAGPISGRADYGEQFALAADLITRLGHTPANPAALGTGDHPWSWYARRALMLMLTADAVLMLEGWQSSTGARLELYLAATLEIPVYMNTRELVLKVRHDAPNPGERATWPVRPPRSTEGHLQVILEEAYAGVGRGIRGGTCHLADYREEGCALCDSFTEVERMAGVEAPTENWWHEDRLVRLLRQLRWKINKVRR